MHVGVHDMHAVVQQKEQRNGFCCGHYLEVFWVHTPCSSFGLCRYVSGAILKNFLSQVKVTGEKPGHPKICKVVTFNNLEHKNALGYCRLPMQKICSM